MGSRIFESIPPMLLSEWFSSRARFTAPARSKPRCSLKEPSLAKERSQFPREQPHIWASTQWVSPERRIRSDRRPDQTLVVQKQERGLQPSLIPTHYSAGRVAALVSMPPQTRSAAQTRHFDAFLRFCPKAHQLPRFVHKWRRISLPVKWWSWARCAATSMPATVWTCAVKVP
jgi:hypothetical protein